MDRNVSDDDLDLGGKFEPDSEWPSSSPAAESVAYSTPGETEAGSTLRLLAWHAAVSAFGVANLPGRTALLTAFFGYIAFLIVWSVTGTPGRLVIALLAALVLAFLCFLSGLAYGQGWLRAKEQIPTLIPRSAEPAGHGWLISAGVGVGLPILVLTLIFR
jgi:hypothetical protein